MYGPREAAHRTALVSFNVAGWDPMELAARLNDEGVESRAGCHCATLAHHQLGLEPPASCRLSFYVYNTLDEVDRAADALAQIVALRTESGAAR
jgi:cysteine desulfurase/selenocysteine lyase